MSEENVKIVLSAEDRATAALEKFTRQIDRLKKSFDSLKFNPIQGPSVADLGAKVQRDFAKGQDAAMRGLRQRFTFETRMSRQRLAEERAVTAEQDKQERARRRGEDASMRRLREQLAFATRMTRQRDAEDRRAERDRAAAAREVIRLDNWRFSLRQRHERELSRQQDRGRRDLRSRGRDVWSSSRDAARDLVRMPAAAGAAGVAAGIGGSRKAMRAESAIDAAEINSRIYGDLSADAARKLRDGWAAPLAESLGAGTDKMLSSYTEALKLGIPKAGAQQFAELATKTSEAWSVEFGAVVDILGTTNSILTSDGSAFDFGRLKSVANTLQHLSAKQSTTPEKLMSFLQRGAGGAKVLGMSQEAGLAFGSASTSLGNQAGQSGRMLDYMASRIIDLPKLTRGHGEQARDARRLVQQLGYGSADALDRQRRKDPDAFLPEFVERFKRIKDPKQRDQAIRFFAGREWLGEFGRMVTGFETYREAVSLSKEAKGLDAISKVWDLHKLKLSFTMKQISTGFTNIMGEAGKAFTPLARDVGDYFLAWSGQFRRDEGLAKRVSAALQGMIEGFGFKDIKDMLTGILGKPGEGNAGAIESWKNTAKAFTSGISDVIGGIKSTISAFTGGDPEVMARWTGRILALTTALVLLGPVIGVLGTVSTFVLSLGRAARALGAATGLTGLAGRAGATSLLGGMSLAAIGGGIAAGFLAAIARHFNVLQPGSKGILGSLAEEFVPAPLRRWLDADKKAEGDATGTGPGSAGTGKGSSGTTGTWQDPPARVQKQSLDVETTGSIAALVKKASYTAYDDRDDNTRRVANSIEELRTILQKAALTTGSGPAAGLGASSGGGSSSGGSSVAGLGSRFFTPTDMSVPGWYGKGRGAPGGVGASDSSPIGAYRGAQTFAGLAPRISADLQKDFGLSKTDTSAILGNLGHESAGFTAFQEGSPRGGGRGGWGWAQWTGPRRRAFEAWTAARGLDPKSYEANYGFLRHELQTSHKGSLDALRSASGLEGKTVAFEKSFEGAAADAKHYDRRIRYARAAAGMPDGRAGVGDVADAVAGIKSDGSRAASAVDIAGRYLGKDEHRDRAELSKFVGHDVAGNLNAWCARFVNGALRDAGVKGTGSAMANSFLKWGQAVDAEAVKKGDVAVEHRNKGAGAGGGHVGLATGNTRRNKATGELEIETVSGNHGDAVVKDWTAASKLAIRRSTDAAASAAVASLKETAATAKRAQDGGNERLKVPQGGAVDIGNGIVGVPFGAKPTTDQIVGNVPAGVGRGGGGAGAGGSGGGSSFTVHQTINGAGENPEVLAQKAQRHFEKASRHSAYFGEEV